MTVRRALLALAAVLLLAGCTAPAPALSASAPPAVPAVAPLALAPLDRASAGAEAKRLADAIQGLIAGSEIVYVDDHSRYTPATKTDAAYYGVVRVISIQPGDDPIVTSASMVATLESSGWRQTRTTDQGGLTLTALVAGPADQQWLVLIGGDATVEGEAVVDLQLASPDLLPAD